MTIAGRVITVSDRCAAGERSDRSGPLAAELLTDLGVAVDRVEVVPDGVAPVRQAVAAAVAAGCRLVLTTGGTGIGPRDQTPEATAPLLDVQLPGVAEQIRNRGLAVSPAAALSRGLVGVVRSGQQPCLVVNAPGAPGGVRDAVAVLAPLLDHIIDQLAGGDHRT